MIRRLLGLSDKPRIPPPLVVELRQATTAAMLARRLADRRRPTGNRIGDALAGYERPIREEADRARLAD